MRRYRSDRDGNMWDQDDVPADPNIETGWFIAESDYADLLATLRNLMLETQRSGDDESVAYRDALKASEEATGDSLAQSGPGAKA